MSNLVINHGNPWWLSPNVWAVPTSDPDEPAPGAVSPMVSSQYFLVANVTNTSAQDVVDAGVYFWWADPSLGVLSTANAHLVGTSSVSVSGNSSNTSLELAPWTPSFVNSGHECLIAAVVEGGGAPPTILDGSGNPTVAQHNLGVVNVGAGTEGRFTYPFQVCNPFRTEQRFTVHAERAPIEHAAPFLAAAKGGRSAGAVKLGFAQTICPQPRDLEKARPLLEDVRLAPFACSGFTLMGVVEKGDALIHVTQKVGDRIVGGCSVLALAQKAEKQGARK